jgi:alkylation response protein AidB-like acyl-CoA dehydrogenase
MAQHAPAAATQISPPRTHLESAREIAPLIRESAGKIEADRELTRPVFEALADAGLFHMAVPRGIGGAELTLPEYVEVIEEIGKADASTAWAVNQGGTFGTFAARMQREAARAIWIDTPRSVVANTPGPTSKAVVVPGGYRVTGHGPFSTGCRHASWIAANAQVVENGEVRQRNGQPETRYCLVPIAQAELLDTWKTRGMRGTGTHTFEVKNVFVPEERTVFVKGAPVVTGGPRYAIPLTLGFACGDAMVALGVARSCMEAFFDLAGSKTPRYVQGLLREQALVQFSVGKAEAALRSGRAYLVEAVGELWDEVSSTGALTLDQRANLRIASTHAIRLAEGIVDSLYTACGATAVFESHPIQRYFQDIHVITQHVQGRLQHYELVGQHWLGLPIDESRL